jgi:hypothetical protein
MEISGQPLVRSWRLFNIIASFTLQLLSMRAQPGTATNARCRVRVERRIHPAGVQPARVAAG